MRDYALVPKLLGNLSDGFTELNKVGLIKEEYFTSWVYEKNSECHARVLGAVIKAFMSHFAFVDIDMFYRDPIDKMKPDLAFRDKQGLTKLLLDYESPNSSDFRIIEKDFEHYLKISKKIINPLPYIVITTLPFANEIKKSWGWRDKSNAPFREQKDEIRKDPRTFWKNKYEDWWDNKELAKYHSATLSNFWVFNISARAITQWIPNDNRILDIKINW